MNRGNGEKGERKTDKTENGRQYNKRTDRTNGIKRNKKKIRN